MKFCRNVCVFVLVIVFCVLIRFFLKCRKVFGWFSIGMFRQVRMLCRCCWVKVVLIILIDVLMIVVGLLVKVLLLYGCEFRLMVFLSMFGIEWLYLGVMNSIVLVWWICCFRCMFCVGQWLLKFWLQSGRLLIDIQLNWVLLFVSFFSVWVSVRLCDFLCRLFISMVILNLGMKVFLVVGRFSLGGVVFVSGEGYVGCGVIVGQLCVIFVWICCQCVCQVWNISIFYRCVCYLCLFCWNCCYCGVIVVILNMFLVVSCVGLSSLFVQLCRLFLSYLLIGVLNLCLGWCIMFCGI